MIEQYEQTLQDWIETIVAEGDDDALFASGYLQGHVAVVLSQLEVESEQGLSALDAKMSECLALARDELSDTDYALVDDAWTQLSEKLAA
ncbi:YfcL family protein [Shewanella pealeana]|uniref:YfcL protein n=1 Tax=Shewanella pealeana (strain ATCC 700345 / ANG-SQ1) TaxID=398579 RepID=A8H5R8_SHEPA|nr:YfcL family protein [Shewanella pealeana]ABV87905.1 YfcL protein [Shewanella pealeana ATCC 700345]